MKTFLFEQYGYYPKMFENYSFQLNGWKFKLEQVDLKDDVLEYICEYLEYIRNIFSGEGSFIVKNRSGKNTSFYDNKKYVLVSNKERKMTLKDFNVLHYLCIEKEKTINLKNLILVWRERMDIIERESIYSLRLDSVYYRENYEISLYGLGLAQNALQYLNECIEIYGEELGGLTLTHKRVNDMDSFSFFNPFNLVIDHPIRDLSELYKNNCIEYSELIEILECYKLDEKLASIMMARLLYPCKIFDLLDGDVVKKDVNLKIDYSIEKEFAKLKKIYVFLRTQYKIMPIVWLE